MEMSLFVHAIFKLSPDKMKSQVITKVKMFHLKRDMLKSLNLDKNSIMVSSLGAQRGTNIRSTKG